MTTVENILSQFGQDSVKIIRDNMQRAGQNATGETSRSISTVMPNKDRVQVTAPGYIYVLETGRAPRKSNEESNFNSKLEQWVRARGINIGKTIEQTTRSLQFLINKYGTKLYREGGRKDIITPIFKQDRFDKLTNDIANAESNKVINVIESGIDGHS